MKKQYVSVWTEFSRLRKLSYGGLSEYDSEFHKG
jgi:hypothetical protein